MSIPMEVPRVIIWILVFWKGEGDDVAKWSISYVPEWATGLHIPHPLSQGLLSG